MSRLEKRLAAIRALEQRIARKAAQRKSTEADHREHVRLVLQQLRSENRMERRA